MVGGGEEEEIHPVSRSRSAARAQQIPLVFGSHMYNSYPAHLCSTNMFQPHRVRGIYRAEKQTKKFHFQSPPSKVSLLQEEVQSPMAQAAWHILCGQIADEPRNKPSRSEHHPSCPWGLLHQGQPCPGTHKQDLNAPSAAEASSCLPHAWRPCKVERFDPMPSLRHKQWKRDCTARKLNLLLFNKRKKRSVDCLIILSANSFNLVFS